MKSNYKPLGKYIQPVVGRNNDLGDLPLLGLSIQKKFIPSIANTIGTDMSTYRIIERNQFAYGPVTSRNGEKITIALFNDYEKALISQAYTPFEVKDTKELDPEYLMMWFRRPEFDRYARFKSHGSAREIFDWDEMCNTLLPIPHIDKQKEIVTEYNAIQNRIKLNEQLIRKLEKTAQAIYREWFVEGIDLENLPEGWRVGKLEDIATITMGQSPEGETYNNEGNGMIFYQGRTDFGYRFPDIKTYTTNPKKKALKSDILISVRAPVGDLNIAIEDCAIGRGIGALRSKLKCNSHLFYTLQNLKSHFDISDREGTIFGSINKDDLHNMEVVYSESKIIEFDKIVKPIDAYIKNYSIQNKKLVELKELLLSKLATVEN
jgi:type I restriction enzyme S subunit